MPVFLLSVVTTPSLRAEVVLNSLYSFSGGADGAAPGAKLLKATDGNFYGTTSSGGASGNGTIFRISADGTFTNLYSFTGGTDGGNPLIELTQGYDGNLYGTTQFGGSENFGTVFRITLAGTFTTVAALPSNNSGMGYDASVRQGADGNFYGTFQYFGPLGVDYGGPGEGIVYQMSPDGTFSNLFSFDGTNGEYPQPGLVLGADGCFYGTTAQGGTNNMGIVFKITTNGAFTLLHSFTGGSDGAVPYQGLAIGNEGELYGTTQSGGSSDDGTVFKITTNGVLSTVYSFQSLHGTVPYPPVAEGADGTLYGMNDVGGGEGEIYQISTNGIFTVLLYFNGLDGASPTGGLVLGNGGAFFGITGSGGTNNAGTVFSMTATLEPVFKSVSKTNNIITLQWSAIVGQVYQLQYSDSLQFAANWSNLSSTLDAGYETMTNYDSIPDGISQRFYRIVLLQ